MIIRVIVAQISLSDLREVLGRAMPTLSDLIALWPKTVKGKEE